MNIRSFGRPLAAIALVLSSAALAADADESTPSRTVAGTTIVSQSDPAMRISLPPDAVYVGAVRWPLYKVADAELHAFVEADPSGLVHRFYWIQFEALLPASKGKYDYSKSSVPGTLSSYPVLVTPDIDPGPNRSTPGSDGHAFRALLADKGYRLPAWMMDVRFIYLPTADRRKELMIIYGEDMDATAAAIAAGRAKDAQTFSWADLSGAVVERARERIKLTAL
jgi:hypothetical protein